MPASLVIAFDRSRSLLKIHAPYHSIFAVLLSNRIYGFLKSSIAFHPCLRLFDRIGKTGRSLFAGSPAVFLRFHIRKVEQCHLPVFIPRLNVIEIDEYSPDRIFGIRNAPVQSGNRRYYDRRGVRHDAEADRSVRHRHLECVRVADSYGDILSHHAEVCHLMAQELSHLLDDEFAFIVVIVSHQHLSAAERVALVLISLDIGYLRRLDAVGVIDKKLRIDAEHAVQEILIRFRYASLRGDPYLRQPPGRSRSHAPEVCKRCVVPQHIPVGLLIENSDEVRGVFCKYVQCDLAQVHVGAYARCCPYAYPALHLSHQKFCHLFGRAVVALQVVRNV